MKNFVLVFTVLFGIAAVANYSTAMLPEATGFEVSVITALHLSLVVRIIRARSAARGQRLRDLAHFRNLKKSADIR